MIGPVGALGRGVAALIGTALVCSWAAAPAAANPSSSPGSGVVGYVPIHLASASDSSSLRELAGRGLAAPFAQELSGAGIPGAAANASDTGPVIYNGGPVMPSNADYVIVWTPSNDASAGNTFQSGYVAGVDQYFKDAAAAGSNAQFSDSVATQYNDSSGATAGGVATFGGELDDTDPLPTNGCSSGAVCLTDAQLQSELEAFLASKGQSGGLTHEYFLLTPPNVVSCLSGAGTNCSANASTGQSYCAYHGYTGGASGFVYANIPDLSGVAGCDPFATTRAGGPCNAAACSYPNGPADGVLAAVSASHNESTTDPEPNTGWSLLCSGGIPCGIVNPCGFAELTDPANQTASNGAPYNMTINGDHYWLQPLYSNQTSAGPSAQDQGHCVDDWTSNGSAATASFAVMPQANNVVSFDASASTGSAAIAQYVWEFNDGPGGSQTSYVETTSPTIQHTFPAEGTYTVALTVLLADGTSNGTAESVTASTAPPAAPTVTGVSPASGPAAGGTTVKITGTNLSSVTAVKFGTKLAHFVAVSDTEVDADSPPGAGTVDVTVTTAGGTSATAATDAFTYGVAPPVAAFTVSSSPKVGSPVSFDASASHDPNPGGAITNYSWDFGDGTASATGVKVTHTYNAAGNYTVTLTVTDSEGGTNSTTQSVIVGSGGGQKPINTGLPQITGTPTIGDTLTTTDGTWTSSTPLAFVIQWYDCDSSGSNCFAIPGENDSTYTIAADDVDPGDTIRVEVIARNAAGPTAATSDPTGPVAQLSLMVTVTGTSQPTQDSVTVGLDCTNPVSPCPLLLLLIALSGGQATHTPFVTAVHKPPIVGKARTTIPAGGHKTVRITLNKAGRRLLAKRHTLTVKLMISEPGHTSLSRTIVLKSKPAK